MLGSDGEETGDDARHVSCGKRSAVISRAKGASAGQGVIALVSDARLRHRIENGAFCDIGHGVVGCIVMSRSEDQRRIVAAVVSAVGTTFHKKNYKSHEHTRKLSTSGNFVRLRYVKLIINTITAVINWLSSFNKTLMKHFLIFLKRFCCLFLQLSH